MIEQIALVLIGIVGAILIPLGLRAAYCNGVTDGYGYSREPKNPGYAEAGNILRSEMAHRWNDIDVDWQVSMRLLAEQFDELADAPVDPANVRGLNVSRSHFARWSQHIRSIS